MTRSTAEKALTGVLAVCLLMAGLAAADVHAAADSGLEAARQELRLRSETERRMREEFEALLANGRMTAAEIADFESYLVRLGRMVDEQRRVVAELQDTGTQSATTPAPAAPLPGDFDRGQTDAEKIALLDAELGGSLSDFDEKLLREQKEIAEKSRAASTGDDGGAERSGGASGEAGEGEGQQGAGEADAKSAAGSAGEPAGGDSGNEGESGQQTGAEEQADAGGKSAQGSDQVASAGGVGNAGRQAGKTPAPADIPDGDDDDIVARQLREAAESEQDPELREKLWEEYRKYKKRPR